MTEEAASRPGPRRLDARPAHAAPERPTAGEPDDAPPTSSASTRPAPGAGSPTCATAVRRPGRRGARRPAPTSSPAATCPAPSSSSCSAASTRCGLPSPELAERVLGASAPGRGRPDLGLVGVLPESAFGPPPVDPADLPADELVRVATALIAEDVVAAGDPLEPRTPRLLRRRYRIAGRPRRRPTPCATPWSPTAAHRAVAAPPSWSRAPTSPRCSSTSGPRGRSVPASDRGRSGSPPRYADRRVPARIDLPSLAAAWVPRVGREPGARRARRPATGVPGCVGRRRRRRRRTSRSRPTRSSSRAVPPRWSAPWSRPSAGPR